MTDKKNGHHPERINQPLNPAPQEKEYDTINEMVERMVGQCRALLRQQLERRVKQEPMLYDTARVDSVMHEFEAASADVEGIIAERVRARVFTHVQQEVLRVLDDALNDGGESTADPVWATRTPDDVADVIASQPPREGTAVAPEPQPKPSVSTGVVRRRKGLVKEADSEPEQVLDTPVVSQVDDDELANEAPEAPPEEEPPMAQASAPVALEKAPSPMDPADADEVYEGTVKLQVEAKQSVRQVIQFVDALRSKSDFRMLQLVGSHDEGGVGIWLGLRAPLRLREVLMQMEGVSRVDRHGIKLIGEEPRLDVWLAEVAASN